MSSILKVLRKIENEKRLAGQAFPESRADHGADSAKPGPVLVLLVGILLGALAAGLLFYRMSGGPVPVAADPPAASPAASAPAEQSTAAAVLREPHSETPLPAGLPRLDPPTGRPGETPVTSGRITAAGGAETPAAGAVGRSAQRAESAAEPPTASGPPSAPAADHAVADPAQAAASDALPDGVVLQVSEIFYQEDNVGMAVVNDLPVMAGTRIGSAVVTDIRPDSVLVKIDGRSYVLTPTPPR